MCMDNPRGRLSGTPKDYVLWIIPQENPLVIFGDLLNLEMPDIKGQLQYIPPLQSFSVFG